MQYGEEGSLHYLWSGHRLRMEKRAPSIISGQDIDYVWRGGLPPLSLVKTQITYGEAPSTISGQDIDYVWRGGLPPL